MSKYVHWWRKIPVLVRAVFGGLFAQVVGFVVLVAILPLNFRILPSVPWTLLPLGVALWAYWSYFGGRGWPRSTTDARSELRRSNPIAPGVRTPVVLAGSLFASTVFVIAVFQYALREMPPEALGLVTNLATLPLWSAVPLALGAAFFIGVAEEMSYRGYMQVPIERRHGPVLGLTIPALVFALSHGIDPMVLPVFFTVSIGWSFLAWRVDSIRPGIVLHAIIDGTAFLWAIFRPEDVNRLAATSLVEQGLTAGYRLLTGIALALVIATIAALVMLHRRTGRSQTEGPSSALEARSSA